MKSWERTRKVGVLGDEGIRQRGGEDRCRGKNEK